MKHNLRVLSHLRQDARIQLTTMSKLTGVPVSTLFDWLKAGQGVITKHTCLLDFTKLGFHTRVNMSLKVEQAHKDIVREYLLKHPSINSLYRINSGFDFMAEGIFMHIKDAEDFFEELETKFQILEKKTCFIVEDIKREGFLSDPALL